MEKQKTQQETRSAEMIKKDNLKFANLWNRMNIKITNKLKKTADEERKRTVNVQAHSTVSSKKISRTHKLH
jgi:hypothetical protein